MMRGISEKTTFGELKAVPEFAEFADHLMVQSAEDAAGLEAVSLGAACGERAEIIVSAARWVQERAAAGQVKLLDLWSASDRAAVPEKERTGLLFFAGEAGKPYIILCAGGAYVSVCNVLEAFPAAKVFAEKGYNVFALTYRVAESPLLPAPQEDLAQAVRVIESRAEELHVLPGDYAVCGFSAGGHLAGSFGTDNLGYAAYGVPKPVTLMLAYPATSAYVFQPEDPVGAAYIDTMIGETRAKEAMDAASAERNMSENYPPVFLTHSRDDGTVPFRSSELLAERLEQLGIPYRFKPVNGCDHGFSSGFGESEHWLDEAAEFFEEQRNRRWFSDERLNDHIIRIQGACREYMYLVEGTDCAALLDTGTGVGNLRDYVRGLTDKPVKVLLTHGHMDHALAAWQFADSEIYMDPKDDPVLAAHSELTYRKVLTDSLCAGLSTYMEDAPVPAYLPIRSGQTWDLGGITIQAFPLSGHTFGSVAFLLQEDRLMLLGDACNCNTLVYDPAYSTTVEEYLNSLMDFERETRDLYDRTFFSHETTIKGSDIVPQMIALCRDVLQGISDEEPVEFNGDPGLMAKCRDAQGQPKDGSDVNIMYRGDRLFRPQAGC